MLPRERFSNDRLEPIARDDGGSNDEYRKSGEEEEEEEELLDPFAALIDESYEINQDVAGEFYPQLAPPFAGLAWHTMDGWMDGWID